MHRLVLLALLCGSAAALYTASDDVVEVDSTAKFNKLIASHPGVAAVEFYAPWCGHCKALAPHWKKAATNLKGIATLGAVDCDNKDNAQLCAQFGIQGFPTIKLFGSDQQKNPYTGEMTKEAQDYPGPRTAKAIVDGVMSLLSDVHVEKLKNVEQFSTFITSQAALNKVVLLSEKSDVSKLYQSLSTQLRGQMAFAQIHSESMPDATMLLGLEGDATLPAVVVFKAGLAGTERYSGSLKAPALLDFLRKFSATLDKDASGDKKASSDGSGDGKGSKGSKGGKSASQVTVDHVGVTQLGDLDEKEDMAIVALQISGSPGCMACEPKSASFLAAAPELQGIVKLVSANLTLDELEQVSRYGLDKASIQADIKSQGCAQRIVLLPFGAEKEDLDDYQVYDGAMEGKSLYKWMTSLIPSMFTMEVTPPSVMQFTLGGARDMDVAAEEMAEGEVPTSLPVPPKVMLFTNKDEVPAVFNALAMAFRHRTKGLAFGWVRAHGPGAQAIVDNVKPAKVPGISLLVPMPKDMAPGGAPPPAAPGSKAEGVSMSSQPYTGANNFKAMSTWLENMIQLLEKMYGVEKNAGPLKPTPQLTSNQDLEEHCVNKGAGICIIGLLGSSDTQAEKQWLQLLSKAAAKHHDKPLHFSWVDASKYSQFAADAGVLSSDFPTAIAVSTKRMRVAINPGSLIPGPEGLQWFSLFIDGVLSGRTKTTALEALPRVESGSGGSSSSGPGSDEAQALEEPVEEEFDLSDIMSEEVEGSEAGMSKEDRLRQAEEELKAEEEAARAKEAASQKKKKKKNKKKKAAAAAKKEEL